MNDVDLREQFHDWAAPLRASVAPDFTVIRRRARRRRGRLAAASIAALAVVGVATSLAVDVTGARAPASPQSRLWGSGSFPAPTGEPYVFVNTSASGPAELRDAATGAVVKVLHPLGAAVNFTSVAAAANDRLFVLAQQGADGQVSFAELRIGPASAGALPPVQLLPVLTAAPLPTGSEVYFMTVNATGTRLALDAVTNGGISSRLVVYNLRNGHLIGSWQTGTGGAVAPPQFLPGGDQVVVQWPTATRRSSAPSRGPVLKPRVISAAHAWPAGSSFLADSRPARGLAATGGALSQDGSVSMRTLDGSLAGIQAGHDASVRLLEYSTASGRLLYNIPVGPASALRTQYYCGVLWVSANGRDLLTQCGTRQQEVVDGKVMRVKLAWTFLAQQAAEIINFAW